MFVKLTLQNSGNEIFLNFDCVEKFFEHQGRDSWTSIRLVGGKYLDVVESATWIVNQIDRI